MRLKGRRALVTGSSRGIGAEIARVFASEGAEVVVNYRSSSSEAMSVVEEIARGGGRAIAVKADVSRPEDVSSLFREVESSLGGLDILVNNAGLADPRIWNAELGELSLEMWQRVFAVDTFGTFLCSQRAASIMKAGGSIINVSSTPAISGDREGLVYACSKGAILTMTRMLARILAPSIRVNCMVLGSFETTWTDWLSKEQLSYYLSGIPLRRFGKPRDAANLALFLASDESSFITGQGIVIDGGEVSG